MIVNRQLVVPRFARALAMKSEEPKYSGYQLVACTELGKPRCFLPNPVKCLPQQNPFFNTVEEVAEYFIVLQQMQQSKELLKKMVFLTSW